MESVTTIQLLQAFAGGVGVVILAFGLMGMFKTATDNGSEELMSVCIQTGILGALIILIALQ